MNAYSLVNVLALLPIYIFHSIWTIVLVKVTNFYNYAKGLRDYFLNLVWSLISPKAMLLRTLRLIKLIGRLAFICLSIAINSLLFCIVINYFLHIPVNIHKDINFIFSDNEAYLISRLNFNCSIWNSKPTEIDTPLHEEECLSLDETNYQISLNLNFANMIYADNTENFEVGVRIWNSKGKEIKSIKRIFFFNKAQTIVQLANDLILFPFRMFGLFTDRDKNILFLENYNNKYDPISRMEIVIRNRNLNISEATISLIPKIGIIKSLLYWIKSIAMPILFCGLFLLQLFGFFILMILFQKNANTQ